MRVLLLGGTGRTGKLVLNLAIDNRFKVHCVARNPAALKSHKLLTIFEGSPEDSELLQSAAVGCDAIISVLNISRKSDFPWSPLRQTNCCLFGLGCRRDKKRNSFLV